MSRRRIDSTFVSRTAEDTLPYIAHDEFRNGAAAGRFRIVVNPALARPWVVHRTKANSVAILLCGVGCALALTGRVWPGAALVALGIAANRLVKSQAGRLVLHLALKDRATYDEVTSNGVMEVRRAE